MAPRHTGAAKLSTTSGGATGAREATWARYNVGVPPSPSPSVCHECGATLTVYDRVCDCGALVNAAAIAELRTRARIGRMSRDFSMAVTALQRALQLVPEEHPEHQALTRELDAVLNASSGSIADKTPADTTRRDLIALCVVALVLLLVLLWPLLTGARHSGAAVDGHSRHPAQGALYPPP